MGVHLSGAKAGVWCDFSTGEVGDALDLVAATLFRGNVADALRWSRAWLGISGTRALPQVQRAAIIPGRESNDDDAAARRQSALRIYLEALPALVGTPAAAYLMGRGIDLGELGTAAPSPALSPGAV